MMNLVSLYYDIIFKPEDIINHLSKIDKRMLILHKIFMSFCLTGSILIQKNKIKSIDFLFFILLIALFYFFISLFSQILSSFFYNEIAMNQRYVEESFIKISRIVSDVKKIFEFIWFPVIFLIHISILSKYFNSYILLLMGILILILWIFYIGIKSLQYYLEWEYKSIIRIIIKHIIILSGFFILSMALFLLSVFVMNL